MVKALSCIKSIGNIKEVRRKNIIVGGYLWKLR